MHIGARDDPRIDCSMDMSSAPPSVVRLPPALTLDLLGCGLPPVGWALPAPGTDLVLAAGAPIEHAEPPALAALGAWAHACRLQGRRLLVDSSLQTPYLWRVGLLAALDGAEPPTSGLTGRFPPSSLARHFGGDVGRLVEAVVCRLGLSERAAGDAMRRCLSEALRNVDDHAETGREATVAAS